MFSAVFINLRPISIKRSEIISFYARKNNQTFRAHFQMSHTCNCAVFFPYHFLVDHQKWIQRKLKHKRLPVIAEATEKKRNHCRPPHTSVYWASDVGKKAVNMLHVNFIRFKSFFNIQFFLVQRFIANTHIFDAVQCASIQWLTYIALGLFSHWNAVNDNDFQR